MHKLWKALIITLVAFCAAGCRAATPIPEAATLAPTVLPEVTVVATATQRPTLAATATRQPTATATATATPAPTDTPTPEPTATPMPTETPTPTATTQPAGSMPALQPGVESYTAVKLLPDPNPAPPLTLIVSANRELVGNRYRVTGLMRNDSDRVYTGLSVVATFFMDTGRRYSPIHADLPCAMIGPGETCPFVIEANARNLVEVLLHPEGYPTERQSVSLAVSGVGRYVDAVGYLHLTGRVSNPHSFAVINVVLTGTLIDGRGEIVNAGMVPVLDALEAGTSRAFDLIMEHWAYSTYRIEARGEPK